MRSPTWAHSAQTVATRVHSLTNDVVVAIQVCAGPTLAVPKHAVAAALAARRSHALPPVARTRTHARPSQHRARDSSHAPGPPRSQRDVSVRLAPAIAPRPIAQRRRVHRRPSHARPPAARARPPAQRRAHACSPWPRPGRALAAPARAKACERAPRRPHAPAPAPDPVPAQVSSASPSRATSAPTSSSTLRPPQPPRPPHARAPARAPSRPCARRGRLNGYVMHCVLGSTFQVCFGYMPFRPKHSKRANNKLCAPAAGRRTSTRAAPASVGGSAASV